ncbi:phosphate-starvation-inducible E, partial [Pseudomonas aeruginosa]
FLGMVNKGHASIDDILLRFIYLELGAMVGIYFKTNRPVTNIFLQCKNLFKTQKNYWVMA